MMFQITGRLQRRQLFLRNLSKDLKKRGFKFTGPVAVLSYLQAAGLVNDHENDCEWKNVEISDVRCN